MITQFEFLLKAQFDGKLKYSDGSFFQGYLMSLLESKYVEYLHSVSLNPYSQYAYFDKERACCVWRISTLTKDARENIIIPLLNSDIKSFEIEGNGLTFDVISKGITYESEYKAIADKYFMADDTKRNISIDIHTPTTFKSEGRYQIFPDVTSLYVSLFNKWNEFNTGVNLDSPEVLQHLSAHTVLDKYDLRSTRFSVDNNKIGGFIGKMSLYVKGPAPLVNIEKIL